MTPESQSKQVIYSCYPAISHKTKKNTHTHRRAEIDLHFILFITGLKGVDGVDVVIGTSSFLRKYSHGKDMTYILKTAVEVIEFVKSKGIEVRFSSEDSFRSDLVDLLSIYRAVDKVGVNRVGIADTVGCANPRQVYDLVRTLRGVVGCDIECHFHDDTGCCSVYTSLTCITIFLLLRSYFHSYSQFACFYFPLSCCKRLLCSGGWCHTCWYFGLRNWGKKRHHTPWCIDRQNVRGQREFLNFTVCFLYLVFCLIEETFD
jgi:hypothetical protein